MDKKELREQFIAIYRRVFKTDKKPTLWDLANLLNLIAPAVEFCDDAEAELGKEVCAVIKRCTKVNKRSVKVDITKFADEIGYNEEEK